MMRELFKSVLEMSLAGSAVILAVLLLRPLLHRCPKKITIFLWLPAALRLVIPVSVPSRFSLFNLFPRRAAQHAESLLGETAADPGMLAETIPAAETVFPALPADTVLPPDPAVLWANIGMILWLGGMGILAAWALLRYAGLRRRMATATPAEGERGVYQSEHASSPFILGVLCPKIYVPYRLEDAVAWQVLLHERTHLRYGDHLTKLFAFGILTLHWFNPLCWLAFALFGRDVEMRCDEAVLACSEPEEYGTALVRLAVERRYSVTGPLSFGETSVKERVKHILSWKKPALWITITAVVVCAAVIVVCSTDAVESPYQWTSAITAEDFSRRSATYYESGYYSVTLTDAQLEALAECLRNVPESAMHMGKDIRKFHKGIGIVVDEKGNRLFWDGEHVILRAVRLGRFTYRPAWYFEDPALANFFAELEASILAGQGTLNTESVPVSVSVSGSDRSIAPKKYTSDTWDFDYDALPVLTMSESGHLCIHVYWQPENLSVYEEYYNSLSGGATIIRRNTYTAAGPHDDGGYTIEVTRINPKADERAIYYITNGEEKYIFKVLFTQTDDAAELPEVSVEADFLPDE